MSGDGRLYTLTSEQQPAVDPGEVVWLSASAGTGKTQVLSARVLRLLLQQDVKPDQILCLTFTKAGATEMSARINSVLARWVRASDNDLFNDLDAIGAQSGPEQRSRARTLFAQVLDCPGGGLRIDTIHAFAQWLLSAFPHEAGLTPGTKAMEDRDRDLLLREVLADLLLEAERSNDAATLATLERLSIRSGPEEVERFLLRCADAHEVWEGAGGWQPPMLLRVKQLLGLPSDASHADLAAMCGDEEFPLEALRCCLAAYSQWNGKKGMAGRAVIADWLGSNAAVQLDHLAELHAVLFTQKDTVRDVSSLAKFEEHFEQAAEAVLQASLSIRDRRALLDLAEWLAPALELGWRFAGKWAEAKARAGFIDFNDQIRQAARLLNRSELSEWIRYKLDRRFDHVLVDEAQDTNVAQWQIINALIGDFFAGEGAHGDKLRTLFVVGDYKQAIFRFQGTSPENFEAARQRVEREMLGTAENIASLRSRARVRTLRNLGLGSSFRTAQSVLSFVDMTIAAIGPTSFGLPAIPVRHEGQERPGLVTLWQVVTPLQPAGDGDDEEPEENWLSRSDRLLADRIARQVSEWLQSGKGLVLEKGTVRYAGAGDIMVLVRKRKELAGLIVARLHAAGVPVAGIDRLRLAAPLAVRDLMAALRFAAQPLDDLNLACLLVSPLIGWSQEELLEHGFRPEGVALWDHLRGSRAPGAMAAVAQLLDLLAGADFEPPQALLHWVLTGPWQGRRRLIARLGREANDPIDELLNAASAFAANEVPSLQTFIRWFDAGEGELKREAGKSDGQVRVMTVHGAKGLQAPIVILADAADDPHRSPPSAIPLRDPLDADRVLPMPLLRKEEKVGPIAEEEARTKREELQEHWRLLYVAMTRAEEALFVAGALGPKDTKGPPADSWYARIAGQFLDEEWIEDPLWGARAEHGERSSKVPERSAGPAVLELPLPLPWLNRAAPDEPRPPRPLAPSALGEEQEADPPWPPGAGADAARRGVLMHRLLERLPEVPIGERKAAAQSWLARMAGAFDAPARAEMAASALAVLEQKGWAELFGPGALAEVPIAATVGGQVVAGTIDRLLIGQHVIRVVDFKTARRPPASLDQVPVAILRQMAAYAAALEVTYPGRKVEAALLYTQEPRLIAIPDELLAVHKQALTRAQESF